MDEGDEDITPLAQEPVSIECELERFRLQWQQELVEKNALIGSRRPVGKEENGNVVAPENGSAGTKEEPSIEEQAKFLFMQGVNAEQSGRPANAIQYYRRALQLVPDIESKIDEFKPCAARRDRSESECSSFSSCSDVVTVEEEEEDSDLENLLHHFAKLDLVGKAAIQPEWETRGCHISSLPTELLVYILKWVVSADLDVTSLENVAMVCRGFFLCARDEGLWKLICQRIWGRHLGSPGAHYGGSYRTMYMLRSHMRSNGVYISRCHYYRQGEKGLDNLYKPFHFVEYFRYARFFPDGKVLMLTTPDAPPSVVHRLRKRSANIQGIVKGYYRLVGDTVTCIMKRPPQETEGSATVYKRYRRNKRNNNQPEENREMTFHAELTLKNAGKRSRAMLVWRHYAVHTTSSDGQENICEFSLNNNNSFDPMVFSQVKSYTAYSDAPLV